MARSKQTQTALNWEPVSNDPRLSEVDEQLGELESERRRLVHLREELTSRLQPENSGRTLPKQGDPRLSGC
jgi:hypothetical protein